MTDLLEQSEPLSLWECLHDGSIVSFESDLMARSLTVIVDSAYHWEFHKFPTDTRFRIAGENVRIGEVFDFEPWLGASEPPRETPWEEAQAQRQRDYEKGRLISVDWKAFAADVATDEDYVVMDAELTASITLAVLELGVMSYPNSNYRTVRIHAERFRFNLGERELSLEAFQAFGAAYWNDRARRAEARKKETDV